MKTIDRRRFLRTAGAIGLVGTAGCTSGGGRSLSENQYYWSARDHEVDSNPEEHWRPMSNVDTWAIDEDGDGQFLGVGGPVEERTHLRYTSIEKSPAPDLRATLKATDDSNDVWVYALGRDEDTPDSVTSARVNDTLNGGEVRLGAYHSGNLDVGIETMDRFGGAGDLYHLRALYQGETWQAKLWPNGEAEPDEWHMAAKPGLEDPGALGLGHWHGAPYQLYELSVGVNQEAAPLLDLEATPDGGG